MSRTIVALVRSPADPRIGFVRAAPIGSEGWCHVVEKEPDTAEDCAKHGMKLCKKHGAIADAFKPELKKLLEKARGMERVAKPQDGDDEEG